MYRDNSLMPSEAIRLLALGLLTDRPRGYAELAREVRHFTDHVVGPSLDLVAQPIELLKVEGLIAAQGGGEDPPLAITEPGRAALLSLLTTNVRPPNNDINKLIIALKMRFLHLLPPADQGLQADVLIEMCERELARLQAIQSHNAEVPGHLGQWLTHDIGQTQERLDWFRALRASIG